MNFEAGRCFFRPVDESQADAIAREHGLDLRARFERDVADARAGKGIPNSEYWLDKAATETGLDDAQE